VGDIGPLADAMVDAVEVARLFLQADLHLDHPLTVDPQFNGLDGADRRAATAETALFLAPEDLPGQIRRA
jgi:hypothetical protein